MSWIPEPDTLYQAVVASGWGAWIIQSVRATKSEVTDLKKQVQKQNGTLRDHAKVVAVLANNCPELHRNK